MSFFKKIFSSKQKTISSNEEFWSWFKTQQRIFFNAVKTGTNIEKDFFDQLSQKLDGLKPGYFFLTGMLSNDMAELIITADGTIKNIVFAEELVASAPSLPGWKFTALKEEMNIEQTTIKMGEYEYNSKNMYFYPNDHNNYPDEIDITIIHQDANEQNNHTITIGVQIFLDNYLGELHSATIIDHLKVIRKDQARKELIPIEKLKSFLIWREKEFIEKYEGTRSHTDNDTYSILEAKLTNGNPLIAVINTELLTWDRKASHPWILNFILQYGAEDTIGLPDRQTYKLIDEIEDDLINELKSFEGYLNIGRETAGGTREIYFACKEFRNSSKIAYKIQQKYINQIKISYEIFKDKYWQCFNHYIINP
ncbi:DUF695 domain-containing protein [Pedobacter cryoconitis]|uniref:DUF695 domain-containing protein n=1 Tax=Pedobacter cryoconitis TaxID=188932 RepID=A0A7X0J1D7_9SPHI|nr:DUF695 domain-containing protein [Pedobacter cryoconitis]MBB6499140.1 hypothetical protein [Pedobacter cryoconitis]